jgi:hypothetical protein
LTCVNGPRAAKADDRFKEAGALAPRGPAGFPIRKEAQA